MSSLVTDQQQMWFVNRTRLPASGFGNFSERPLVFAEFSYLPSIYLLIIIALQVFRMISNKTPNFSKIQIDPSAAFIIRAVALVEDRR